MRCSPHPNPLLKEREQRTSLMNHNSLFDVLVFKLKNILLFGLRLRLCRRRIEDADLNVEVCDATKANRSSTVGYKNYKPNTERSFTYPVLLTGI